MTSKLQSLKAFLAGAQRFALVEVADAKGSTPRETGTTMLVSTTGTHGTIGGGQLEYMAIDKARQLLSPRRGKSTGAPLFDADRLATTLDIPLGPEIGQCCGGRVAVSIRLGDPEIAADLVQREEGEEERLPHLYIFGGGHVGHAMAASCALMPVRTIVVDTRADALEGLPEGVEARLTPVPEDVVRDAPSCSAFAVLTHDHALDFLIVAEALQRTDTAYVGMIGSKTKKATFKSWFLKTAGGTEAEFARLVSPIGGDGVKDKRPTVIAALAAAEIMTAFALQPAPAPGVRTRAAG
ncbi:xanthine dehydrogenase accessory protein XdhC [Mesorhizobium sp. Root157]|uniref:xanthine dehydrogenase accessory protein XdhC n=1 Tax=Mesorhizobium sp. Root157 TaxID=1736477 RepID=UPI0006FB2BCA|nr:xanthine dehydrogenase accessory protein XdhC [Mesorhizobium sp. Root157]KQZ94354.1 xanthine dehydrogenase accessory protein XdhC [Mesorhizobium sp. Root157]